MAAYPRVFTGMTGVLAGLLVVGLGSAPPTGRATGPASPIVATSAADEPRIADMQAIGSHDSEHVSPNPAKDYVYLYRYGGPIVPAIDKDILFTHDSIANQLDSGARQLELDVNFTPGGNTQSWWLWQLSTAYNATKSEGTCGGSPSSDWHVIHSPFIDCNTNFPPHGEHMPWVLGMLRQWSDNHKGHLPILVHLDPKVAVDGHIFKGNWIQTQMGNWYSGASRGPSQHLNTLLKDKSLLGDRLLTPADVVAEARETIPQIDNPRDAVAALGRRAWPTVADSRGKFLFVMQWYDKASTRPFAGSTPDDLYAGYNRIWSDGLADASKAPAYFFDAVNWRGNDKADWRQWLVDQQGTLMPANIGSGPPWAAAFVFNDAIGGSEQIPQLVQAGFLVRLRADAVGINKGNVTDPPTLSNSNESRRNAALASGAQFIATDWLTPTADNRFMPKTEDGKIMSAFRLPGNGWVRCTPATTYEACALGPDITVSLRTTKRRSRLVIDVNPDLPGAQFWRLKVHKWKRAGTQNTIRRDWRTIDRLKTRGAKETVTAQYGRGRYRVVVKKRWGHTGGVSKAVRLKR